MLPSRFVNKLVPGNRVRIKVTREARTAGYVPCPDNTIAIFHRDIEVNGREFAEIKIPSGGLIKLSYDHIVEIVKVNYDLRRAQLFEMIGGTDYNQCTDCDEFFDTAIGHICGAPQP